MNEPMNGGDAQENAPEAQATIDALRRGLAAEGAPAGFTEGVMRRVALAGGREARAPVRSWSEGASSGAAPSGPPPRPWRERARRALIAAAAVWTVGFVWLLAGEMPGRGWRTRSRAGDMTAVAVRHTGGGDPRASWVRLDLLEELGAAGLIDRALASGQKQAYRFDAYWDGENPLRYWIIASPAQPMAGDRYFYVDESGVIRVEVGKVPTERSPAIGG